MDAGHRHQHAAVAGPGWTIAVAPDQITGTRIRLGSERPAAFMDAVEGDGSLRAHLLAALAWREIAGLSWLWDGPGWRTHELVRSVEERRGTLAVRAVRTDAGMRWQDEPVSDVRPVAEWVPDDGVRVRLYTLSEMGQPALYEHEDLYHGDSVVPVASGSRVLAVADHGGWVP